jgi:hypothetical protein
MGAKQLDVTHMRQVLEPAEIFRHIQDAFYVDFCIERGRRKQPWLDRKERKGAAEGEPSNAKD